MQVVAIQGNKREGTGKKATKAVRNQGQVPCVIYGGDNVVCFSQTEISFRDIVYTPDFKLVEIEVEGKKYKCILKDIQFHPVTDKIVHIDFLELVANQAIKAEVPIRCFGSSPGVKLGGKLLQDLRRAKIKTTPEALVHELTVDISSLELGQSVRVRDVIVPEGVELMNATAIPVASIEIPRALRSATSSEAAEEAAEAAAAAPAAAAPAE